MHRSAHELNEGNWEQVKGLAQQILDLLDNSNFSNAVKLMAIAEVTMLGGDHMEKLVGEKRELTDMEVSDSIH
jgi:hypothetical protein